MSAIAILSFLVGVVLGRRLRVLVLIPAIAAGLALVLAGELTSGASLGSMLGVGALVALGLQLGYVAGALSRHLIAAARTPSVRAAGAAVARSRS